MFSLKTISNAQVRIPNGLSFLLVVRWSCYCLVVLCDRTHHLRFDLRSAPSAPSRGLGPLRCTTRAPSGAVGTATGWVFGFGFGWSLGFVSGRTLRNDQLDGTATIRGGGAAETPGGAAGEVGGVEGRVPDPPPSLSAPTPWASSRKQSTSSGLRTDFRQRHSITAKWRASAVETGHSVGAHSNTNIVCINSQ